AAKQNEFMHIYASHRKAVRSMVYLPIIIPVGITYLVCHRRASCLSHFTTPNQNTPGTCLLSALYLSMPLSSGPTSLDLSILSSACGLYTDLCNVKSLAEVSSVSFVQFPTLSLSFFIVRVPRAPVIVKISHPILQFEHAVLNTRHIPKLSFAFPFY